MSGRQSFSQRVAIPLAVILATVFGLGFLGLKLMNLKPSASSPIIMTTASGKATQTLAVVVLNDTGKSGLARTTADAIAQQGWVIKTIGNYSGPKVSRTTVFYPAGFKSIAGKLAADVSGGTAKATSKMSQTALTLVISK